MKALFALLAVAPLTITTTALAADVDDAPRTADVETMAHVGAAFGSGYAGGVLGATVLARSNALAAGGTFEASGAFATRIGVGGVAGVSLREDRIGADLLGIVGVHAYQGVGRGLLSDDPGASATLPYAGVRGRFLVRLGEARRFHVGLTGAVDRDLGQTTKSYAYTETPWLSLTGSSGPRTATARHTIGFTTVSVLADLGMTFDL